MRIKVVVTAISLAFIAAAACNKDGQATPAAPGVAVAAPPAGPAAPVGDKQFRVETAELRLKAGAAGVAKLTIKPAAGMHFNKEYPAKFAVTATAFAKCPKDRLTVKGGDVQFVGDDGVVVVPLQGVVAGSGAVEVIGSFSVCNDEQCYMLRDEKLALQVVVQ